MTTGTDRDYTADEKSSAIRELQDAARSGCEDWSRFGRIKCEKGPGRLILNYTQQAMFANEWTVHECLCRGLILDSQTGEIVARPFDKFFNWGQGGRKTGAKIVSVTEKMDGSLGVSYRNQWGETCIATRGSFVSDQALFATDCITKMPVSFHDEGWTLLFEIIYPENRIVVDYGGFAGLVLLAIRNTETGEYAPRTTVEEVAAEIGCQVVESHEIGCVDDLLSALPSLGASREGFVAEFADGSRFKFKGEQYCEIAKAIQGLTFKNVIAAVQAGTLDQMLSSIPDEVCDEAIDWAKSINTRVESIEMEVRLAFGNAPRSSRKDFAIWVHRNCPEFAPHLFAMFDGRDCRASVMSRIHHYVGSNQ